MIKVRFEKSDGKMLLETSGHAEVGPDRQIICAAISALAQGFFATLQSLAESYPENVTVEEVDLR
jgi:uncharacterized protein YsxB (DUF464 family)